MTTRHADPREVTRTRWRSRSLLLVALVCCLACDTTALRVLIVGSLSVPHEVDELVVIVRGGGEEATSRHPLSEEASAVRESLTLLPGERMRAEVEVRVEAQREGLVVASGAETGAFRAGQVQELIVALSPTTPGDGGTPDAGPADAGLGPCLDADGDGYGDGPGCLGIDCDETNDQVNEGALEVCNDIDDDCDSGVDEGCECPFAGSNVCGTLQGECSFGVQICTSGVWSDCDGAISPRAELCNGDDDDCDGEVDEGCQ